MVKISESVFGQDLDSPDQGSRLFRTRIWGLSLTTQIKEVGAVAL